MENLVTQIKTDTKFKDSIKTGIPLELYLERSENNMEKLEYTKTIESYDIGSDDVLVLKYASEKLSDSILRQISEDSISRKYSTDFIEKKYTNSILASLLEKNKRRLSQSEESLDANMSGKSGTPEADSMEQFIATNSMTTDNSTTTTTTNTSIISTTATMSTSTTDNCTTDNCTTDNSTKANSTETSTTDETSTEISSTDTSTTTTICTNSTSTSTKDTENSTEPSTPSSTTAPEKNEEIQKISTVNTQSEDSTTSVTPTNTSEIDSCTETVFATTSGRMSPSSPQKPNRPHRRYVSDHVTSSRSSSNSNLGNSQSRRRLSDSRPSKRTYFCIDGLVYDEEDSSEISTEFTPTIKNSPKVNSKSGRRVKPKQSNTVREENSGNKKKNSGKKPAQKIRGIFTASQIPEISKAPTPLLSDLTENTRVKVQIRSGELNAFSELSNMVLKEFEEQYFRPALNRNLLEKKSIRNFKIPFNLELKELLYSRIPAGSRSAVHYTIGHLFVNMMENPNFQNYGIDMFSAVEHLVKGLSYIKTTHSEHIETARKLLRAARAARNIRAFQHAHQYLYTAAELIHLIPGNRRKRLNGNSDSDSTYDDEWEERSWEDHFDLAAEIFVELSRVDHTQNEAESWKSIFHEARIPAVVYRGLFDQVLNNRHLFMLFLSFLWESSSQEILWFFKILSKFRSTNFLVKESMTMAMEYIVKKYVTESGNSDGPGILSFFGEEPEWKKAIGNIQKAVDSDSFDNTLFDSIFNLVKNFLRKKYFDLCINIEQYEKDQQHLKFWSSDIFCRFEEVPTDTYLYDQFSEFLDPEKKAILNLYRVVYLCKANRDFSQLTLKKNCATYPRYFVPKSFSEFRYF